MEHASRITTSHPEQRKPMPLIGSPEYAEARRIIRSRFRCRAPRQIGDVLRETTLLMSARVLDVEPEPHPSKFIESRVLDSMLAEALREGAELADRFRAQPMPSMTPLRHLGYVNDGLGRLGVAMGVTLVDDTDGHAVRPRQLTHQPNTNMSPEQADALASACESDA